MTQSEVFDLTQQLINLLENENTLLREMRLKDVTHQTEEKEALLIRYRHLMTQGERMTNLINSLDAGQKEALRERTQRLLDLGDENQKLLSRVTTANQRFIDRLTGYLQKSARQVATYGPMGRAQTSAYRAIPAVGMSIAMNQQM
ncbi:MAG: hypothetical protein ACK5O7_01935 [Holosporales bacterium]